MTPCKPLLRAGVLASLLAPAAAGPRNPSSDELLVSAFTSGSVTRHAAQDGAFELAYAASPLAGTLVV